MKPVDRDFDEDTVDRLIISLRAYVERGKEKPKKTKGPKKKGRPAYDPDKERIPPSDWILVFDCETRTTPDQRLRFGGYQLRYKGQLFERGIFYEPGVLSLKELATLRQFMKAEADNSDGEGVYLHTRAEFVEKVFYERGYAIGAQIVGFNLPFDLSRLAIQHWSARGDMRGGFGLSLSETRPAVAVKHLSRRAALIRFTGERSEDDDDRDIDPDESHETEKSAEPERGYFVDVKTLAAALTSKSFSLELLSNLLKVPTPKLPSDDHGEVLTPEYIQYALRDVQSTWECFDVLARRFDTFGLKDTGLCDLYSEASLGKAYLKTMNITPWRKKQPGFPPKLIGLILTAYYGGRSEVHIRRQITPIIHCDFLSMYPTVCTLMGLWNFVRAKGITHRDDTRAIRDLMAMPRDDLAEHFRQQDGWQELQVLVQVLPQRNLFPVRARYPQSDTATIGLNYLTSDEPMWFTLADVIASKILSGETPNVLKAIRFEPMEIQDGLSSVKIAEKDIDPATDDFYRSLIVHRNEIKQMRDDAVKSDDAAAKESYSTTEKGIKILANATSYGIFVELNVEDFDVKKEMVGYGMHSKPFKFKSKKFEKPGRYFHPLLGTLITGAARLMLGLAQYQVTKQNLDWAFCDTDSIAIANSDALALEEFKARALRVIEWFKDLNPYGEDRSILQLEKVNFPPKQEDDLSALDPPLCLTISAKRYVIFNEDGDAVVVRKASGHGLGHLMAPYDEPSSIRQKRIDRIGVPAWQEDLWKEIICATKTEKPDEANFKDMQNFDGPAASQYAATTPELLRWFKDYNESQPDGLKIFPFGFLLSLQAKSKLEMGKAAPEDLGHELWNRRTPRPASPFFKKPLDAQHHAFDRERGTKIPVSWLKSHARSLNKYHLHQETKFEGGEYDQRGLLQLRHVHALTHQSIGKEADNIEENEFIGEDGGPIEYSLDKQDKLAAFIEEVQAQFKVSDRKLTYNAGVSEHTIEKMRNGKRIEDKSLFKLVRAAEELRQEGILAAAEKGNGLKKLKELETQAGNRNKLANLLGISGPYLGRIIKGEKPMTEEIIERINKLKSRS